MSLGGDVAAQLPYLRAQAESRFTESLVFFTAVESTDQVTFDPLTVESVVASTRGRVKWSQVMGRDLESGGQFPVVSRLQVHVAVGSASVSVGVFVRVTASESDAGLVGRVFRVSEPATAGQVTAWRYPVEEVS